MNKSIFCRDFLAINSPCNQFHMTVIVFLRFQNRGGGLRCLEPVMNFEERKYCPAAQNPRKTHFLRNVAGNAIATPL